MLVIATPNPDSVAETFIRQHIRLVLPGKTGVIYFNGDGNHINDLICLKIENRKSKARFTSIKNVLLDGYAGSLTGRQKKEAVAFLRENRVTAVLAEFGQTACALKSVCKQAKVPLFAFFHGHDASAAGRKLLNRYSYWRMSRYVSKVFVPTKYFANKVSKVGIPKDKIYVAPYGLEVENFTPAKNRDYKLVIAVGRMVEKKAPHLTIQAFARTLREIPDARLELIGDGPMLNRAKDEAIGLGISDKVIFHGSRSHEFVNQKVSQASLFVQHSLTAPNGDTESLGVSLLEAMACEVPVVTTRHNGFVETIDDGVTGFLVAEKDVDGMAERMIDVLSDRSLRDNMGREGRKRVNKFYESRRQAKMLRLMLGL